jgi:hypothetical protein
MILNTAGQKLLYFSYRYSYGGQALAVLQRFSEKSVKVGNYRSLRLCSCIVSETSPKP